MTLANIANQSWLVREGESRKTTFPLMVLLERYGHWNIVREPTKEEDIDGIDLWVEYPQAPGKEFPIQFKIRSKPKFQDFIIARYQPCWGMDREILPRSVPGLAKQTANGRDWNALIQKKSVAYYVATMAAQDVFDEISYVASHRLRDKVLAVDAAWENSPRRGKFKFTEKAIDELVTKNFRTDKVFSEDGGQVWYQKNYRESPKFVMYVDKEIRQGYFKVKSSMQDEIKNIRKEVYGSNGI